VANPSGHALEFFLTKQESYHTCADCCANRSLSCLWIHLPSALIKQHEEENSEHQHKELHLIPHLNYAGPLGSCIGSQSGPFGRVHYIKQERQCTCRSNIAVRSRNHCCCGKAMSITYSECVSVAVVTQAMRMHIVICDLTGSSIFFHIITMI
jgi:hypothetical protein